MTTEPGPDSRIGWPDWAGCLWFLLICFGASAVASFFTSDGVESWYPTLNKPAFTPPDLVFSLVWTALYVAIAIAGWRLCARRNSPAGRMAMAAWILQLGFNVAWSFIFFGFHKIGLALVDIGLMAAAIAAAIVLALRVDRLSAWLLAPYLAWAGFAGVLNYAILRLN